MTLPAVLLATLTGCGAGDACNPPESPAAPAVVIYVEGAGGDLTPELYAGVAAGLRGGGYAGEILDFQWNTGAGLVPDHVSSEAYKREHAAELAALIARLAETTGPIDLIAFSAGSAVATYALEMLDAPRVRNVIFIQSSLSSGHDMSAALANMTGRLTNFTSPIDPLLLATGLAGTADRAFCGPCAIGLRGVPPYDGRVCNVAWRGAFVALGHAGGHFDALRPSFVAAEIAPRVLGSGGP